MKITRKTFGVLSNGKTVRLYILKAGGLTLSLSEFGAAWTSLLVPSRGRGSEDVLLGFSGLEGYTGSHPFFGVTIGRFANRIGGAGFSLGGKSYRLFDNDNGACLHGGRRGFDKRFWKGEAYEENGGVFTRFTLTSPDGDEGFPGTLKAEVSYGVSASGEIIARYDATLDAPSPVNLTNHAYFNLAGEGSGSVLDHKVTLFASVYAEVDERLLPTGQLLPVQGGPFDFRKRKLVGRDIAAAGGGYDHCFAVDGEPGKLRPCAEVHEPRSGRSMRVFTTQPGVQFYTGNSLPPMAGKAGSRYGKHSGLCLETQRFPDSPNRSEFPTAIFGPDREYHEKTVLAFDW
ncbi:MAG: aldose 1-epimerase [Treponematales bacterium]